MSARYWWAPVFPYQPLPTPTRRYDLPKQKTERTPQRKSHHRAKTHSVAHAMTHSPSRKPMHSVDRTPKFLAAAYLWHPPNARPAV
ncbi:hypothetical protein G6F31_016858 [Rhizopus arrhizus]|nr:hypothetical protein G6F31_016858 [Rhizopus arrhizus]